MAAEMSFMIKYNNVLAIYSAIWDEIRDLTNKEFYSKPVYYDKYIKTIA